MTLLAFPLRVVAFFGAVIALLGAFVVLIADEAADVLMGK